jgi:hypothetical protein
LVRAGICLAIAGTVVPYQRRKACGATPKRFWNTLEKCESL